MYSHPYVTHNLTSLFHQLSYKQAYAVSPFTRSEPCNEILLGWHVKRVKCIVIILAQNGLNGSIQDVVSSVSQAKLWHTKKNIFIKSDACLQAKENHFHHFL